jgi:hypothetical protein
MSWKKYFTPVKTTGQVSPISGNSANPTRSNYSSFLPDVYSGHPNRLERYSQYNTMALDPEIAAALDILAEFCTQPNEENGTPFQIFFREQATSTEIKIIKKYLQQWSKLNKFGIRMFKIARNTFMYGDSIFIRDPETLQLMFVDCAKLDKIIVNESEGKKPEQYVIRDLNINFEDLTVAQINPTNQNTTPGGTAYVTGGTHQRGMVGAYPQSIGSRFEINQNQRAIDAKHVLHLSMSEGLDDNFPFGASVLEGVFKVYKQKELLEDAIIIYRIQRAPERRIFYIDVGNMPSHLAMSFVERVKQEVNQRRIPSLTGGGCFSMDTRVPLLDGRVLTISELAEEYQQGKENWAFSCNPNTGEMVPGIISWAGVTHESADVLELQLDNGEKIICTPDHKFPIQGKGFVQAKDIVVNQDSLFSFNTRLAPIENRKNNRSSDYHQVFDHPSKKWVYTHRVVANYFKNIGLQKEFTYSQKYRDSKKTVIHHKDFNRYNNNPSNLVFMYHLDHMKYHADHSAHMLSIRTSEEQARIVEKYRNTMASKSAEEIQQIKEKTAQTLKNKSDSEKKAIYEKIGRGSKLNWDKLRADEVKYQEKVQKLLQNLTYIDKPWQNQHLIFTQELFEIFYDLVHESGSSIEDTLSLLNSSDDFMNLYKKLNKPQDKMIYKLKCDEFTKSTLLNMLEKFGFKNWKSFLKSLNKTIKRPTRKLKWDESMLKILVDEVNKSNIQSLGKAVSSLNSNQEFISKFKSLNYQVKGNARPDKFTQNTLKVFLQDNGYESWTDFKQKIKLFNHKIISVRKIPSPIQVGTLTIDGDEKYHNFHTFAISQGVYTKNSSVVDASYNPLAVGDDYFFPQSCLALDQHIKLLDNRSLTLAEIIQEYESGKQNYTYTVNQKTLELEPGKIVWAGVTRKNTQIVEVLLDNGEKIKTTPDHRYIMRDGSETEAQYLKPGDSLMPLYLHNAVTGKNQGAEKYLRYTCPATGKKKWVHTMVCPKTSPGRETEIHHIDLNSLNNNPTNLVEMNTDEHRELHRQLGTYHLSRAWSNPEKRAKIVSGMHQYHANATEQDKQMFRDRGLKNGAPTWQNPASAPIVRDALRRAGKENAKNKTIKISDGMCSRLVELYDRGYDSISKLTVILRTDEQFQAEFKKANGSLLRDKNLPDRILPTDATLVKIAQHMGYTGWDNFKKTYNKNHQVVSVTWLPVTEDTGDITIESASGSHNFALTVGVFIHNSEGRGSKVDTLPGGCLAMDTSVSLLDGRELTIREIQQEMDQGKTLWTYSCDPDTGKVVPGLITWAGVTQQSAKVMRITLDNGQSVVCTPDHPFVTRHRGRITAQDLRVGDSMMPLYRRKKQLHDGRNNDYEQFYDNAENEWIFTHRMVADDLRDTVVKDWIYDPSLNENEFGVRHHMNFNRYDNSPENLCFMNHRDHIKYHADHNANFRLSLKNHHPELYESMTTKQSEGLKKSWQNLSEEEYEHRRKIASDTWKSHTDQEYTDRCEKISQGIVSYVAGLDAEQREKRAENSRQAFVLGNQEFNRKMDSDPEFYDYVVGKRMKYWTPDNREKRAQVTGDNQRRLWSDPEYAEQARVKLAERQKPEFSENMLRFVIDQVHGKTSHQVNALAIVEAMNDNQQLLQELHDLNADKKIANWSGKFTPSILKISMMKYFGYKNWADFHRKESVQNHRIVSIEHLEEPIQVGTLTIDGQELFHGYHTFALSIGIFNFNSNLGEISDLLFFTQKLMRALRIPSSYLPTGVDDSQATFNDGRVGTAYIQELRFNKYCERLQSLLNEPFDTEFKYYLSKKGVNIDFNLFDLRFNPPQNFAAYRQAEMDTARVSVYTNVSQVPHLSKRFALKRFLGLTAEELAENEKLWREENVDDDGLTADAKAELRSAGITPAGLAGDMDAIGQAIEPPPDQMPDEIGVQPAAGPVSTGAPSQPAASGTPTP